MDTNFETVSKNAKRVEKDTLKGREEYGKLQKELDEVTALNDKADARTRELIDSKEELVYEIKQLKQRKDKLDRQNEIFEKIAAAECSKFQEKATEYSDSLVALLKEQKLKVEQYSTMLNADGQGGISKTTDVSDLSSKGTPDQEQLAKVLDQLQVVLKKKVKTKENNPKQTVKKTPAKTKAKATPTKPVKKTPGRKAAAARTSYQEDEEESASELDKSKGTNGTSSKRSSPRKRRGSVGSSRASSKRRVNEDSD